MLFIFSTRDLNRSEALGAMKNQLSASWTRRLLMRFNHVASAIVNANHCMV